MSFMILTVIAIVLFLGGAVVALWGMHGNLEWAEAMVLSMLGVAVSASGVLILFVLSLWKLFEWWAA